MIRSETERYETIQETMKIIDIIPTQQVIYIYGDSVYNHLSCFREYIEAYYSKNQQLKHWLDEERVFTVQDYFVKQNHILILNLTREGSEERELLIMYQDSTDEKQKEVLWNLLENSDFTYFRFAVHNQDNRYGPYHYQESVETLKTLKKRRD